MSDVTRFAYIGSRTTLARNARGEGITVCVFDPVTGRLAPIQVFTGLSNPSYLALHPQKHTLYTVHGDGSDISALRIDATTGKLTLLNTMPCEGLNPVHLALDHAAESLIVSNHLSGALVVLALASDGALGKVMQRIALPGEAGPHKVEQAHSKPHFNLFDPSGRWVIVPDKGTDCIHSFGFNRLGFSPSAQSTVAARQGAGPRNVVFHPSLPFLYAVNELDSTVTCYHFNVSTGSLTSFQIVSTLPDSFTSNNRAGSIQVHPNGKALFVSNRGHDSIATFHLSTATGRIAFHATAPSGGRTPRFFTLSPTGQWLYALNEDSDTIQIFQLNPTDFHLKPIEPLQCKSAVCMVFSL